MSHQPMMYISRKVRVSAAHRMNNPELSEEENHELFGKCGNIYGHGHNYTVNIILYGPVDPVSGMVINLTDLKHVMEVAVERPLDHKNIDKQVDYFKNHVSTLENITLFIWENVKKNLPKPELLYEVCVQETDKNVAYYRGE